MSTITDKPKYVQVAGHLRELIRDGELKVGDRLPSYVEMYRQFGATTSTAQRVCNLLEQEQLIERRSGSGLFVAAPRRHLTGNIGFIGTVSYKTPIMPFYQQLVGAMHEMANANQKHLLYLGTMESWDAKGLDKVDGVLLCNLENPKAILDVLPPQMPRVSILTILDGIDSVGVDNYRAAQMAVRHLLDLGHTRIACLMERFPYESRHRYAGYRDALLDAGIEADPDWVRLTTNDSSNSINQESTPRVPTQLYRDWGRLHMTHWLDKGWQETQCTAIVAQNEIAAIGVMQVLQARGIRVPDDVSVMGFDGTELCDFASPRLGAVVLPLAQIGARAIEVLEQQIAGEPNSGQVIMLPLSLSPGESVAAPSLSTACCECR